MKELAIDSDAQTVGAVGEFGLIERIRRGIASQPGSANNGAVVLGIGDDTAALVVSPGHLLLATCDSQVENVHFRVSTTTPELLGRKALAVNLSDIASMAGVPRFVLVSLGLPPSTPLAFVDGLYAGLRAEAAEFGTAIVGGNIAASPAGIFIDITLLGEVESDRVLRRGGARVGDRLVVTGTPGDSAGGLALLIDASLKCPPVAADELIHRHRCPTPRVAAGRAAGALGHVHAMIDISDGLLADLAHIAEASNVGAVIWAPKLPLSPALVALGRATGLNALEMSLTGGEDYELLLAVAPDGLEITMAAIEHAGVAATEIGEILEAVEGVSVALADGTRRDFARAGFRHF